MTQVSGGTPTRKIFAPLSGIIDISTLGLTTHQYSIFAIDVSPSGNVVAVLYGATSSALRLIAVPVNADGTFGTPFGAPAVNPAITLQTEGNQCIAFSPDGNYVAIAGGTSPYVEVYNWTDAAGFGAKVAAPASPPAGTANCVAWSPASNAIAVGSNGADEVKAWPWAAGFGAAYGAPGILPSGHVFSIAWDPSGVDIVVGDDATPFIQAYPWTHASGFGAKYANPGAPPAGEVTYIAFGGSAAAGASLMLFYCENTTPYGGALGYTPGTGFVSSAVPSAFGSQPNGVVIDAAHGLASYAGAIAADGLVIVGCGTIQTGTVTPAFGTKKSVTALGGPDAYTGVRFARGHNYLIAACSGSPDQFGGLRSLPWATTYQVVA